MAFCLRVGLAWFLFLFPLYSQQRIFRASALFQPIGVEVTSIPTTGYAIMIAFSQEVDNLLREERWHYLDGQEVARWYLFYLPDGRVVRRVQMDVAQRTIYDEALIYRQDHRLWLVLSAQRSYLIGRKAQSWQAQGVRQRLSFFDKNDPQQPQESRKNPPTFLLDSSAIQQVEEIWQDGVLIGLRYYRYGVLERERRFSNKNRYEEIFYHAGEAVVKRIVVDDKIIAEEVMDGTP
ncbi:hypothetical protein [Entomospira culicis]|nr:hypothetical protein [Entomospira culicis]WDI37641.1 hypothetical protein PVA46_02335 [Entomospira culicis]